MVGALILIGGAGFFSHHAMASSAVEAEDHDADDGDAPVFLTLAALQAPVLEGRRIDRYVTLGITLELADEAAEDLAKELRVPLRDALVRDLFFQANMTRTRGATVHLPRVKARFLILTRRVLGEDAVKDVLVVHAFDPGF